MQITIRGILKRNANHLHKLTHDLNPKNNYRLKNEMPDQVRHDYSDAGVRLCHQLLKQNIHDLGITNSHESYWLLRSR